MTIADIVSQIKLLAHDSSLSDPQCYTFIDLAIRDINKHGYLSDQLVLDETVTVLSGTSVINTAYEVAELVSASILNDNSIIKTKDGLALTSNVDEDTDVTISYYRKFPFFDGADANNIISDPYILVYGGTWQAMVFNMAPEAQLYQQKFVNRINDVMLQDSFVVFDNEAVNVKGI